MQTARALDDGGPAKKKKKWAEDWLLARDSGRFSLVWDEFYNGNRRRFFTTFRMWPENFDELLEEIEPAIYRQDTNMRQAISSRHRLMATLRFMTSGASFELIAETARIAPNTLVQIVPSVCDALWKIIGPQVIHLPTTSEEWLDIAADFGRLWDYPKSLGAVDGKHVKIFAPPHSGTVCYNYKQGPDSIGKISPRKSS